MSALGLHNGPKSDIAPCPRSAKTGSDLLSVIKVAEKKGREATASSPICG